MRCNKIKGIFISRYLQKCLFDFSKLFFWKFLFFYYTAYFMYAVQIYLFRFTRVFFIRPCLSQTFFKYVDGNYAPPCESWKVAADHTQFLIKCLILIRRIHRYILISHLIQYQPVITIVLTKPARAIA